MNIPARKNSARSFILIIANLVAGFVFLGLSSFVQPGYQGPLLLLFFLALNLFYLKVFRLNEEAAFFYEPKRLYFLFIGFAIAFILVLVPALFLYFRENRFAAHVESPGLAGFFGTLCIVTWEELWFRGLYLNYCRRSFGIKTLSIIMGLLFMLMHVLNPEIDLLVKGPALFLAGTLLTFTYLYCKNFWLPLGLHLGNNFCSRFFERPDGPFFTEDGYLPAILLACLLLLFFSLEHKHPGSANDDAHHQRLRSR
jgi:membrane protease YdiL (CAAX protease family)